jgi:ABC-type bacteriocin/lantibiotic exporter with double-glycine peptidase domain
MEFKNISFIKSIFKLLPQRKKYSLLIFVFLITIGSFAEVISISSTLVFAEMVINPNDINKYLFFLNIEDIGQYSKQTILFFLAGTFIIIIIIASFIRGLIIYFSLRLSYGIAHYLNLLTLNSFTSFKFYLKKKNNINNVLTNLQKNHDIGAVVNANTLLVSSSIISLSIFILMILVDPYITMIVTVIVGTFYFLTAYLLKGRVNANSKNIAETLNKRTFQITNTFKLLKHIILNNLQEKYVNKFRYLDYFILRKTISNNLISSLPGLIIVTIIIAFIIIGITLLSLKLGNIVNEIPKLAALVFSIQRIIPNLQQVYLGYSRSRAHMHSARDALNFIKLNRLKNHINSNQSKERFKFKNSIKLKNLSFKYEKNILFQNTSIEILKNVHTVIYGKSGIGKSTLIDILLGINQPSSGKVIIDNLELTKKNFLSWNRNISYITQDTFIYAGTFFENVAIDSKINDYNKKKVIECCKIAQIHQFIDKKNNKYNSLVAHEGNDLSVGQKQRIGIARALFKDPKILISDEGTNSIDLPTEKKIFTKLNQLKDITILHISHKKEVNQIFKRKIIIKNNKLFLKKII